LYGVAAPLTIPPLAYIRAGVWAFSTGLQRARKQGRVGGRPRLVLDRDQMRRLRNEGKSLREISDQMGLSLTTTARILKTA
jgi:DNA invertase Pin-like site-specific DNA recombinase